MWNDQGILFLLCPGDQGVGAEILEIVEMWSGVCPKWQRESHSSGRRERHIYGMIYHWGKCDRAGKFERMESSPYWRQDGKKYNQASYRYSLSAIHLSLSTLLCHLD